MSAIRVLVLGAGFAAGADEVEIGLEKRVKRDDHGVHAFEAAG